MPNSLNTLGEPGPLVVFFTVFPERRGGSDEVLSTLLRRIDRGRLDALVVFLGDGGFPAEMEAAGIRVERIPGGRIRQPLHLARSVRALAEILRRERPALIVNWLSTAQIYGGPASVLAGMRDRVVWWQHDLNPPGFSRNRLLDRLATLLPARAVGACSAAVVRVQSRIRPHRPTFALLAGIEDPVPHADSGTSLRAELGISEERFVVGSIGRLFEWKGHDRLIEAIALLVADGLDAHGLIVGGGGHRPDERYETRLRRLVAEKGLEDRVTFTGQVESGSRFVPAMNVFVSATRGEPFGLGLLEAMAMEVPVIAVDTGGPPEIIENGVSGILVPTGSPSDLASHIRRLAGSPELSESMAKAGRSRWKERFTASRMTEEFEQRIAGLIDE